MQRSEAECKKLIFKIGIELGASPKLIATRLLSEADKHDMLSGHLDFESLLTAVKVWIQNGMPDYANGKFERYKPDYELPMQRYRGMGKSG